MVHYRRYASSPQTEPPIFLLIRLEPFVPLCLASQPREVNPGTERACLLLEFSQESGLELERLTRKWIGSRAAVIIGGEVITIHKIREAIKGGLLRVSCCAEGAREYLFRHLENNF